MQVLDKNNQPIFPLWGWVLVFTIVVCTFYISYLHVIDKNVSSYENEETLNLQRLENSPKNHSIIALGSSLTQYAFEHDKEVNNQLNTLGINKQFIRISAKAAKRSSYENILSQIADSKPFLVFVELEMLQIIKEKEVNNTNNLLTLFVNQNISNLKTGIRTLKNWFKSSPSINKAYFKANYGLNPPCEIKPRSNKKIFKEKDDLNQQHFTTYPEALSNHWVSFFDTIKKNGGNVIMVEMGRSNFASKGLTSHFKSAYKRVKEGMIEQYNINTWKYSGPYTLDYYCDLAHLNTKGTENFMIWFLKKLQAYYHD